MSNQRTPLSKQSSLQSNSSLSRKNISSPPFLSNLRGSNYAHAILIEVVDELFDDHMQNNLLTINPAKTHYRP